MTTSADVTLNLDVVPVSGKTTVQKWMVNFWLVNSIVCMYLEVQF